MAYLDQFETIKPVEEEDWELRPLDRMKAGLQESFGTIWGGLSAVSKTIGWDSASDWAANRAGELFEEASDLELSKTNFKEIDSVGDFLKWGSETLTTFIPDLGLMALGGVGLGTAAATATRAAVGKKAVQGMMKKGLAKNIKELSEDKTKQWAKEELFEAAIKKTAKDAGRLLGVAGTEGFQGGGQAFLHDLEQRGDDASPLAAYSTGAAQTAIAMLNPLNKFLAGRGKTAGVLGMTLGEAAEETGQEAIAMAHEAGIDPNKTFGEILKSEEGLWRLFESGVAGSLLGGTFGGVLRAGETTRDRGQTAQELTEEITQRPEKILQEAGILERDVPKVPKIDPADWATVEGGVIADAIRDYKAYSPELPSEVTPIKQDVESPVSEQAVKQDVEQTAQQDPEPLTALKKLEDFDNEFAGQELSPKQVDIRNDLVEQRAVEAKPKGVTGLDVLEVSTKSDNKVTSALSTYLLKNVDQNKLKGIEVRRTTKGPTRYNPNTNRIILNNTSKSLTTSGLHEVVHGITTNEMMANEPLRNEVLGMLDVVKFRLVKDGKFTQEEISKIEPFKESREFKTQGPDFQERHGLAYSLINEKEFLAQAFSNKEFQDYLKTVEVGVPNSTKKVSLWKRLVDIVGKVLGLNKARYTMLEKVISIVPEISETDVSARFKEVQPESEAQGVSKSAEWGKKLETLRASDIREDPSASLKEWGKKAKVVIKDIGKGVDERLRAVMPELVTPIRKLDFRINRKNIEYHDRIKPFIDSYNSASSDQKLILDHTLRNTHPDDVSKRDEVLSEIGATESFKDVVWVLKDIYKRKGMAGLNDYGAFEDYFPRAVKDLQGLMQAMQEEKKQRELKKYGESDIGDTENFGVLDAELEAAGVNQADREKAIMDLINTGRSPAIALLKPGSSKKRSIERVSSKWNKYYDNTHTALINHIHESNEAIESRKLFGDVKRKQLVLRRDTLYKELESGEEYSEKERERKVGEIQLIEENLKNFEGEFREGISSMLEREAPNLTQLQQDEVIDSIRARLLQKGMQGPASTIRNLALMSVLGSPTSAITQLGDFAFTVYEFGPKETVSALLGKKIITQEDLDLTGAMKEFQTEGTAKVLDRVLKWSGLQFMDQLGKSTFMTAAINSSRKMDLTTFTKKYGKELGKETEQTWKELKSGKKTELVRFFAFNALANFQPISLSSMPIKYLMGKNGRIFYALKTYNVKALNNIYRESVHNWRTSSDPKDKKQAAKNVGRLILLMTFAGATADELKDFLLGKDPSAEPFSDKVYENLLKIAMMSRYTLETGVDKGLFKTLVNDLLAPPMRLIDDPLSDIYNTFSGDPSIKSIQNLPWGKLPYNWFSADVDKREMNKIRNKIFGGVKKGDSPGKFSEDIRKYNQWAAKEIGRRPIKISSLIKAKKKALRAKST